MISLRNDRVGAKILREPDYSKPLDNPYFYGAPILFPVNRIFGGSFTFENRKYNFPINEPSTNCHLHGFLHQAEFKTVKFTEKRATLKYISNYIKDYFGGVNKFSITITYKLTKNGIKIKTTVENLSNANMPVMLGYHTTFNSRFIKDATDKVKVGFDSEIERI